jgi:RNA polymerase sigma factor (sigma-70 family)
MKNLDRCICEAIHAGDEQLIQKAYESCKNKVVSFLRKKGLGKSGPQLAEDFYNDAWAEFLIKVATGKNGFVSDNLKLTNFLIGIAYNIARNANRKNCKMTYFGDFEGAEPNYEAPILEIFEQLDRECQLKQAMAKLQPDYREVVELTYFEEVPDVEIAKRAGITKTAVRKRRERAKKTLLEYMQEPQQPQQGLFNNREIPKALENDENTEIKGRDQPRVSSVAEEGVSSRAAPQRGGKSRGKYRGSVRTFLERRSSSPKISQTHQGPGDEIEGSRVPERPKPAPQPHRFVRIIRRFWTALLGIAATFLLMVIVGSAQLDPGIEAETTAKVEAGEVLRPPTQEPGPSQRLPRQHHREK